VSSLLLAKSRRRVLADSAQAPRPKRRWWRTDWSLSPWNETIGPRQRPRSRRCLRVAIIGVAEVAPPFSADASLLFRCGGASTSWRRSRTTGTRQSVRRSASDDPFRHDDADLGGYSFGDEPLARLRGTTLGPDDCIYLRAGGELSSGMAATRSRGSAEPMVPLAIASTAVVVGGAPSRWRRAAFWGTGSR